MRRGPTPTAANPPRDNSVEPLSPIPGWVTPQLLPRCVHTQCLDIVLPCDSAMCSLGFNGGFDGAINRRRRVPTIARESVAIPPAHPRLYVLRVSNDESSEEANKCSFVSPNPTLIDVLCLGHIRLVSRANPTLEQNKHAIADLGGVSARPDARAGRGACAPPSSQLFPSSSPTCTAFGAAAAVPPVHGAAPARHPAPADRRSPPRLAEAPRLGRRGGGRRSPAASGERRAATRSSGQLRTTSKRPVASPTTCTPVLGVRQSAEADNG